MCGIAGVIGENLAVWQIEELLCGLAQRGRDATGIAFLDQTNNWRVFKICLPADNLVKWGAIKTIVEPWVAQRPKAWLFHTRFATHGKKDLIDNAHPITSKDGMLIHNGMVDVERRYRAKGQTDSEQLLLDINRRGYRRALSEAWGYYSIAYAATATPTQLLLARSEYSDLAVYKNPGRALVFASTVDILDPLLWGKSRSYPVRPGTALWWDVDKRRGRHELLPHIVTYEEELDTESGNDDNRWLNDVDRFLAAYQNKQLKLLPENSGAGVDFPGLP